MKKIILLIIIAVSALGVTAQQSSNLDMKATPGASAPVGADLKGGKVAIPAEKSRPVNITKTSTPPVIDGHVDEEAWKQAAVFKDFYQTGPGYNTAPSRPTEVYVMYDEHNLYVAFKCWDEKDKIRATVAKRDNVFGEDNVRMWLDTYNDQRRAYVFGFNPLGIQQDGIFTEGDGADFSVDIVMESKGVIEDWGWSVEAKIPFRSIRYTSGKGKLWGFNVARNIDRFNDEFDQWLPEDRDVSGFLVQHGKISGLDEIKYERTLEIVPSITLSETGERVSAIEVPSGRFVNHQIKKELGVNLKYTLSPNITLDAAVNPDYAEIEADAPVVSANQRFPIFFQEKRPFFLEGKEIFNSPLQPFYSRTIVDPDVAVKLTGKIDKTSFGILAATDNAPGNYSENERTQNRSCLLRQLTNPATRCPINEFLDKNAIFGVIRLKRDFGKSNNIGFFGTARVFPKNRNFVSGFDGTFKFDDSTTMTFQALGTHSRKNFYSPVTDSVKYRTGNGFGYFWSLDYTKETHGWYAEVSGRTSDYRSDAGFSRRTDTNTAFFANRWSTKSNGKAKLIRLDWSQFVRYSFDWKGREQYLLIGSNVNLQLQGSLFINAEAGDQREHLYEEEFGAKRNPLTGITGGFFGAPIRSAYSPYASIFINKVFNKRFNMFAGINSAWGAFDYDFGAGERFPRASAAYQTWANGGYVGPEPALDPGPGHQLDIDLGFTFKPLDPLTTSLNYTKSKLTRNDTGLVAYDTNIFSSRTTYQFTRFTFARMRWDYDTLSSRAAGQFLVGWNPNPGTAFYVGYNDDLNIKGFNPYTGALEPGLVRNRRTIFIRASYLFRKSF
ncbi:MAG: DUF5916 domain-containing protein [Pyrinomonadaceae bacterium]